MALVPLVEATTPRRPRRRWGNSLRTVLLAWTRIGCGDIAVAASDVDTAPPMLPASGNA
ncbi:hypothetical protein [Actinoplanes sp. GCM10030250]|uniref:hypothetical protein n=1 Tax=Actinoplanes sp. GCM10030250 TaxID=3273376 RepID=UPI00361D3B7E